MCCSVQCVIQFVNTMLSGPSTHKAQLPDSTLAQEAHTAKTNTAAAQNTPTEKACTNSNPDCTMRGHNYVNIDMCPSIT